MRFTAEKFRAETRCFPLGDIVYLPKIEPVDFREMAKALSRNGGLWQRVPERFRTDLEHAPTAILPATLKDAYVNTRIAGGRKREPSFTRMLNQTTKRYVRWSYLIEEGCDPFAIVLSIPRTGLGYVVNRDGLTEAVVRSFNLFRLQGIRQLALLHDPVVKEESFSGAGTTFEHSRYQHTLDVAAIAHLIGANNNLSRHFLQHLRVAALGHDALTPAGGDTTKLVDPSAFDEDSHFVELLAGADWENLRRRYRLSQQLLVETVRGQGRLGAILDLADKIAYVARDADFFVGRYGPTGHPVVDATGYRLIKKLVEVQPFVCGIWDSIRLADGRVFAEDAERFGKFLLLRALLFRMLYYHPGARFLETLVSRVVVERLYRTGRLAREDLLRMTDGELDALIGEAVGEHYFTSFIGGYSYDPRVLAFDTREDALEREQELIREGAVFTMIEEFGRGTRPATHVLVRQGADILPFAEARPSEARNIENIIRPRHPVRLYYFPSWFESGTRFRSFIEAQREKGLNL